MKGCDKEVGHMLCAVGLGVQPDSEQRTAASVLGHFPAADNSEPPLGFHLSARMGARDQPLTGPERCE